MGLFLAGFAPENNFLMITHSKLLLGLRQHTYYIVSLLGVPMVIVMLLKFELMSWSRSFFIAFYLRPLMLLVKYQWVHCSVEGVYNTVVNHGYDEVVIRKKALEGYIFSPTRFPAVSLVGCLAFLLFEWRRKKSLLAAFACIMACYS